MRADSRIGPDTTPGRSQDASPPSASSTDTITHLLALSDERDWHLARLLAAERTAYQRGFADGRATACVALAELEQHHEQIAWWREWRGKVQRIIQAEVDPGARMNQVMREITEDQKFTREARRKLAEKPWQLSPLEWCVLKRIRGAGPGTAAQLDRAVAE